MLNEYMNTYKYMDTEREIHKRDNCHGFRFECECTDVLLVYLVRVSLRKISSNHFFYSSFLNCIFPQLFFFASYARIRKPFYYHRRIHTNERKQNILKIICIQNYVKETSGKLFSYSTIDKTSSVFDSHMYLLSIRSIRSMCVYTQHIHIDNNSGQAFLQPL